MDALVGSVIFIVRPDGVRVAIDNGIYWSTLNLDGWPWTPRSGPPQLRWKNWWSNNLQLWSTCVMRRPYVARLVKGPGLWDLMARGHKHKARSWSSSVAINPTFLFEFFFRPTPDGSRQVVYQAGKTIALQIHRINAVATLVIMTMWRRFSLSAEKRKVIAGRPPVNEEQDAGWISSSNMENVTRATASNSAASTVTSTYPWMEWKARSKGFGLFGQWWRRETASQRNSGGGRGRGGGSLRRAECRIIFTTALSSCIVSSSQWLRFL